MSDKEDKMERHFGMKVPDTDLQFNSVNFEARKPQFPNTQPMRPTTPVEAKKPKDD